MAIVGKVAHNGYCLYISVSGAFQGIKPVAKALIPATRHAVAREMEVCPDNGLAQHRPVHRAAEDAS